MTMTPVHLIAAMCLTQVLGMLSFSSFPALLPVFLDEWALSGTEAGWLSGLFFVGYMGAVPVLSAATDRIDARIVYLTSTAIAFAAALGFALLADGFWSAVPFRVLAGAGMAGTYMPGLKALTDRIGDERIEARAVTFYTSSFSIGVSLSYVLAGELADALGWRWAFGLPGLLVLAAFAVAYLVLRPKPVNVVSSRILDFLDFRPVFRNRRAMAFVLAYAAHNWELFGMRAWIVAFLAFAAASAPEGGSPFLAATTVAALVGLVGMPANIFGAELAIRFGRARVIPLYMGASVLVCGGVGFTAGLPYAVVVAICLLHGVTATWESAAITTGAVQSAQAGRRGATMAVHTFIGLGVAVLGAAAPGIALDLAGGPESEIAWRWVWITIASGAAFGPLALRLLRREEG